MRVLEGQRQLCTNASARLTNTASPVSAHNQKETPKKSPVPDAKNVFSIKDTKLILKLFL